MKTLLKVFLLLASVALIVGGSLYFAKTRLDPPRSVAVGNPHVAHVGSCIAQIQQAHDDNGLYQCFFRTNHLIGFVSDQGLVTAAESDSLKTAMLQRYVPAYARWCNRYFKVPTWYEGDLRQMRKHAKLVRGVKDSTGKAIAAEGSATGRELDEVMRVLERYDSASYLVRNTEFVSMQVSESRIARARRLRRDEVLSYNVRLVHQLDSVAYLTEKSHFKYLEERVEHMSQYAWMNGLDNFMALYDKVSAEIDDYEYGADEVYGRSRGVNSLRRRLETYKSEAERHYDDRPFFERVVDEIFG